MTKMIGTNVLSQIKPKPLERVSPSRFFHMECCNYREVLLSNRVEKLLPSSPNTYFGSAAHKFLEKAGLGLINHEEDFESDWLTTLSELESSLLESEVEKHLVPLSRSVKQYEIKKRLLFKRAASLLVDRRTDWFATSNSSTGTEKWYQTNDGIVGGYVDKVLLTNNGYEIIDFKTGTIIDKQTHEIKEEYKYQMSIYAALSFENLKEWPTAVKIQGLNGEEYPISYKKHECIDLLYKAKALFHHINDLVVGIDNNLELQKNLANPAPNNCRFCGFRPICSPYWEVREDKPQLNWSKDIRGEFKSLTTLGNESYLLKITSGHKTYKIRGLKPERHRINERSNFSIYNLSIDKYENCFIEDILTTIYTS
jgi:CRISPR/Cas system-associated exonuclease Cas4 (RecB family)